VFKGHKFAALLLLLFVLAVPLVTCGLPGVQMTRQESECCQHMADMCGSASMQDSHSCCKKVSLTDESFLLTAAWHAVSLQVSPSATIEDSMLAFGVAATQRMAVPPESPPASNAILRI